MGAFRAHCDDFKQPGGFDMTRPPLGHGTQKNFCLVVLSSRHLLCLGQEDWQAKEENKII